MKAVFIKLGGSLITDKAVAFMIRQPEIDQLASEISAAIKAHPETRFFIGNGAGSFGHYMVHQTNWLQDKKSVLAISQIRQSTGRLNAVVLDSLLAQNIPAISFGAAGFCQSVDGQYECDAEAIINYANLGAVPLVYGDVIYDNKQGSRIIPTEDVLDQLAEAWVANGNQVISTIYLATSSVAPARSSRGSTPPPTGPPRSTSSAAAKATMLLVVCCKRSKPVLKLWITQTLSGYWMACKTKF